MKFYFFCVVLAMFYIKANILASPPQGGIGDGYIYPIKQPASKPKRKDTTTYYAKPLHPPVKKPSSGPMKPKPEVFKVIIENQEIQKPASPKHEQIFKVIHLPANGKTSGGGKTVEILKIIHLKGGQKRGWSK